MVGNLYKRWRTWTLTLMIAAFAAIVCGCGSQGQEGSVEDLTVRRYQYNIDEDRGVVRVFGEIENKGKAKVAAVEVRTVLRSLSGSRRGENMTILENIKPHERRLFSLTVTSHGQTSSVQIELATPLTPP